MTQKAYLTCIKVSTALVCMLFFQVLEAQYDFSTLDARLQQSRQQLGGNLVALVFKDGKQVYKKELGDFTAATPAPIASCSKWLTAALVMQFVDEGKLSLDDYVSKYIPDMQQYGKGYITIRQCLSHTTGIHSDRPLASIIKLSRYQSLEEEVKDFMSKHELDDPPGKAFYYSSIGLNMAGRVLEIIGKKPFDRLIQDKLLRPLAMRNTSFASERAVNPSGGAKSTATDYMNFLQMIAGKGIFNGKRILSEKAVGEMQRSQTANIPVKYTPVATEGYQYGLGEWIVQQDANGGAVVVSSPGLFGTWPVVNNKKGYAAIIFVKTILNETRKELYTDIYKAIDDAITK